MFETLQANCAASANLGMTANFDPGHDSHRRLDDHMRLDDHAVGRFVGSFVNQGRRVNSGRFEKAVVLFGAGVVGFIQSPTRIDVVCSLMSGRLSASACA